MSLTFGPIFQMGYVVRDMDRAIEHLTKTTGIGPFFINSKIIFNSFEFRGKPAEPIEMKTAHAYSGDIDVELICQTCDRPSIYQEHLATKGEGLQHVGILSSNYHADLARHIAAGHTPIQAGSAGGDPGVGFCYFDNAGAYPGTMVELIEATEGMVGFLEYVKKAARDWDGSRPVRGR